MNPVSALTKVGHVALVTPDLDRSVAFWRDVVGLEETASDGNTIFLRAWGDMEHHTLSLRPGAAAVVDHVGFRVRTPDDLDEVAEYLAGVGVPVRWIEPGEELGQGRAARVQLPTGHQLELYHDIERPTAPEERRSRLKTNSAAAWARGISPRRIDHVNVTTVDAGAMRRWLETHLGFGTREVIRTPERTDAAVWMGVSALSHDIAVMTDGAGRQNGFHHLAYWQDDAQDVLRAADILREHGIQIDGGPGRHGVSQALYLYVRDPGSGHRLELFTGGYLVLDHDWEPIEWSPDELPIAMSWWGPDIAALPEMALTTSFMEPSLAGL